MSKAEEAANKRYCIARGDDTKETSGIDMQRASDFIESYHQAEKDLELSWEDIREIYIILLNVQGETSDDYLLTHSIPERIENEHREYKETLKRYFEWKNNKTVQQRIKENPND